VAPVIVACPACVRVTVDPLKPVPVISMVCEPLFTALAGDMLITVGAETAAVPVAVNVTGEPVSDSVVAVSVFDPAVVPRVQLPMVAIPFTLVVAVPPVTVPPPDDATKVTITPLTGVLSVAFLTMTLGGVATAVPAVADWLFPAFIAIVSAAAGAARSTRAKRNTTYIKKRVFFIADFPFIQTNGDNFASSLDTFY
jgi:hypothetical protein